MHQYWRKYWFKNQFWVFFKYLCIEKHHILFNSIRDISQSIFNMRLMNWSFDCIFSGNLSSSFFIHFLFVISPITNQWRKSGPQTHKERQAPGSHVTCSTSFVVTVATISYFKRLSATKAQITPLEWVESHCAQLNWIISQTFWKISREWNNRHCGAKCPHAEMSEIWETDPSCKSNSVYKKYRRIFAWFHLFTDVWYPELMDLSIQWKPSEDHTCFKYRTVPYRRSDTSGHMKVLSVNRRFSSSIRVNEDVFF